MISAMEGPSLGTTSASASPEARGHLPVLLLGFAVSLLFVGFLLASTEGHFVPPVVDLYVVCQYARAWAEGHPFHYMAGDPASTGATSLLHTFLLAAGHALGARGEGLVAFAVGLGVLFFLLTIALARRIGIAVGGESGGTLAGALVALNGPVAWGFLYGSDISLFLLLATFLLDRMLVQARTGAARGVALAGVLLAVARPEGLPIGCLLALAALRRGVSLRARLLALAPATASLLVLALYGFLTGSWLGTSVADKSLFANYGVVNGAALVAQYGVDVMRGVLLGFYPSESALGFSRGFAPFYFPPLALLLVLLATVHAPKPIASAIRRWLLIVGVVWVLVTPNVFMGVHFNRYLLWAFPGLLALGAPGIALLAKVIARGDLTIERPVFRATSALCLVLGGLSAVRFAAFYADGAGEVWRRDVSTALWITKNLPQGVAMANIATSVEFLTGHKNLNLHGVTSPAFFGNRTAEREAGTFEALGRLPEAERPAYLISSVSTQEGSPLLRRLTLEPPLFQSSSFGDELLVLRLNYELVGKSQRLFSGEAKSAVSGLREVDRINVCDSQDEAAHRYSYVSRLGNLALNGTVRIDSYPAPSGSVAEVVADAGRAILGHESFRVRTTPGRDLVVVMRTAGSAQAAVLRSTGSGVFELEVPEAGVIVRVGSEVATRVGFRPHPGWNEFVFRVPARLVRSAETDLRLQGRYVSHFFWFFQ